MKDTIHEIAAAEDADEKPPPHSGSAEIGGHLFNFLFDHRTAPRSAATSSFSWFRRETSAAVRTAAR